MRIIHTTTTRTGISAAVGAALALMAMATPASAAADRPRSRPTRVVESMTGRVPARSNSPAALPNYCAAGIVQPYAQVGGVQGTTARRGSIALSLKADTGTGDCHGIWPGGTLYVAAARCRDNSRFSNWRTYTGPSLQDIATDVVAGTCFKLIWYGVGGNSWHFFQGRVIWPQ